MGNTMGLGEGWKRTVGDGTTNKAWDEYDSLIQTEVTDYNHKLGATPGYANVGWTLLKAVLWVESGGPHNPAWKTRPFQIGNPGDPAMGVLQKAAEGSDLIMSTHLKADVKSRLNEPKVNVQAGIAYLFTRMMKSQIDSVFDPGSPTPLPYVVVAGDSFDAIAKKVGSTIHALQITNPSVRTLHPKQEILYRKATMKRVITGWLSFTTHNVGVRYNVGDPSYS